MAVKMNDDEKLVFTAVVLLGLMLTLWGVKYFLMG
jgi:hypothetical protein